MVLTTDPTHEAEVVHPMNQISVYIEPQSLLGKRYSQILLVQGVREGPSRHLALYGTCSLYLCMCWSSPLQQHKLQLSMGPPQILAKQLFHQSRG